MGGRDRDDTDEAAARAVSTGRFAPSSTGPAHPGTLLAGLLCWLDARSRGDRVVLRLEDLDPDRSNADLASRMIDDLAWLGLDWDQVVHQSERADAHAEALEALAEQGRLYPCSCTRSEIRALGIAAEDGGWRYPGTCRERSLPPSASGGWRGTSLPLRVRLPARLAVPRDESGLQLRCESGLPPGDPIVRRRDGAVSYHLASVVDDHGSGVTRVVRGRDLAPSTPVQVALQQLLGMATPVYRHHLLLLEERGGKLAKLHGAVGAEQLRRRYSAFELCGVLAHLVGLEPAPRPVTPRELALHFDWERVRNQDLAVRWTGKTLEPIAFRN